MMKALFVLALLIGGIFAAWKLAYPEGAVRYRLTLETQADGKPIVGSGVFEYAWRKQPRITPESHGMGESVRGEAVAVDFGARGILFAVLRERDWDYAPDNILFTVFGKGYRANPSQLGGLRLKAEIPLDKLWMLVRFRDIGDPKTVEAVDPNDLEKSFGPGVKLKSVTIEITSDPVTTGIEKRLGWLKRLGDRTLGGTYLQPIRTFAERLGILDFKRGL